MLEIKWENINIKRLLWWLSGKEYACNAGVASSIPGLGRSHGEGHGDPLWYPCQGRITWVEKPGGPQSIASQRVKHDWSDWEHRQVKHIVQCLECSVYTTNDW